MKSERGQPWLTGLRIATAAIAAVGSLAIADDRPPAAGSTFEAAPVSAAKAPPAPAVATTAQAPMKAKPGATPYRYQPARFAGRAGKYYKYLWGIDELKVKEGESGQILRFSWRVVDPDRAAPLNDKKLDPKMVAPERGVSLVVPVLDKIGQMRQTMPPETGRSYWMAFSNKGHVIKRGDRVDVVVGTFRAEGLVVD